MVLLRRLRHDRAEAAGRAVESGNRHDDVKFLSSARRGRAAPASYEEPGP
jgi:hypothetical protein